MNSLKNNKEIFLDSMKEWEQSERKLIVGIDGYSGAGKTTLLKEIKKENADILIVHRDDFAISRKVFWNKYEKAKDEKQKMDILANKIIDVEELKSFLKKYKETDGMVEWTLRDEVSGIKDDVKCFDFSKKVLLLEGIFLFHDLDDLLDKKVFIDIDQEVADERRRRREKKRWGKDYYTDTNPDSAFRLTKIAFNNYLKEENPKEQADLVIEIN